MENFICEFIFKKLNDRNICLDDYITSERFVEDRSCLGGYWLGFGDQSFTNLDMLFYECLSDDDKRGIFKSPYEIGHPDDVCDVSLSDLDSYLYSNYGGEDSIDLVKNIKKNIFDLTGVKFSDYVKDDISSSYKVLALFYRVCRQFMPNFFTFISRRSSRFVEYEYRAKYPYKSERGIKNSSVLSEVLSCLKFGMEEEDRHDAQCIERAIQFLSKNIEVSVRRAVYIDGYGVGYIEEKFLQIIRNFYDEFVCSDCSKSRGIAYDVYSSFVLLNFLSFIDSEKKIYNVVHSVPINMTPLDMNVLEEMEEDDIVKCVVGDKKIIDIDAKVSVVKSFLMLDDVYKRKSTVHNALVKSMVINDQKEVIEVRSKVFGDKYVPYSINSMLNKIVNGNIDVSECPGAFGSYWRKRFLLVCHAVQSDCIVDAVEIEKEIIRLSAGVDMLFNAIIIDYKCDILRSVDAFHAIL